MSEAVSPPAPSAPAGPSPRKRWLLAAVAIGVVVIAIVAVLFATGAFRGAPAASVFGIPIGSSAGLAQMNSVAAPFSGGPWSLLSVTGYALATSIAVPSGSVSTELTLFGCGAVESFVPGFQVTYAGTPVLSANGFAATWVGLFGSGGSILVMAYGGQKTSALFLGSDCTVPVVTGNSTGLISSEVAASVANAAGGSAYLANATPSLEAYSLLSEGGGATWEVGYQTCGLLSSSSGTGFFAVVNATPGILIRSGTESCGAP